MTSDVLLSCLCLALLSLGFSAPDSQGSEFIIALMQNKPLSIAAEYIELLITTVSNTPTYVTVSTPKFNRTWSETVIVSRGSIEMVQIPTEIRGQGIEKSNKGVWILATDEVSVYVVNKESKSTDAYLALPVDVLGQEYYALTFTRDPEIMLVASEDDTQVSIQWPTGAGPCYVTYEGITYKNGDFLNLTLDKFETFHVLQIKNNADFTGAHVTSNKPIGMVSGNRKIPVPAKPPGSADHLTEMMMPVDTWGKSFLTSSTPDRSLGDIFRIVSSEDNTTVLLNGTARFISKAGDFLEIDIPTGDYQAVTSDKPVLMSMFAKTFKKDGEYYGDPSMSTIVPEPQYASDYTWTSITDPTGSQFSNKVAVVIDQSKMHGLRLDGINITWQEKKDIPSTTKVHLWTRVTPGPHNMYHIDPSVTFMALVSGTYQVNSYAFAAGLRLARINAMCVPSSTEPGDIIDNDCDGKVDEEILNAYDDDGDGEIDEDLAVSPRVHGNWGEWGSWGSCSTSCSMARSRACDHPAPANNGVSCVGLGAESAPCKTGACPAAPVPSPSATSTGATPVKTTTPGMSSENTTHPAVSPENNTTTPAQPQVNTTSSEISSENTTHPAVSPENNTTTPGEPEVNTTTPGVPSDDTTYQAVYPEKPTSPGQPDVNTTTTTGDPSLNGNWSTWSGWSNCSGPCDSGTQTRERYCNSPPFCLGGILEIRNCSMPDCSTTASPTATGLTIAATIIGGATGGVLAAGAAVAGLCCLYPMVRRKLFRDDKDKEIPEKEGIENDGLADGPQHYGTILASSGFKDIGPSG